jgi:hypothetical protein
MSAVSTSEGLESYETQNWLVTASNFDYGVLTGRNQLIKHVIGPMIDEMMPSIKSEHIVDSGERYTIKIFLERVRDVSVQ